MSVCVCLCVCMCAYVCVRVCVLVEYTRASSGTKGERELELTAEELEADIEYGSSDDSDSQDSDDIEQAEYENDDSDDDADRDGSWRRARRALRLQDQEVGQEEGRLEQAVRTMTPAQLADFMSGRKC